MLKAQTFRDCVCQLDEAHQHIVNERGSIMAHYIETCAHDDPFNCDNSHHWTPASTIAGLLENRHQARHISYIFP